MGNNTNQTLATQQTKDLQAYLNKYGYTDDSGSALAVDGSLGPKTHQALQKFNVHQNHMNTPDSETRDMQELLSESGYKNADGTPLKVDGVHGPNTDAAINSFENDFLSQVVPNYIPKTVQTTVFPKVPNLSKIDTAAAPSSTTVNTNEPGGMSTGSTQTTTTSPTQTSIVPGETYAGIPNGNATQTTAPAVTKLNNNGGASGVNMSGYMGTTAGITPVAANTDTKLAAEPVTTQMSNLYKQYAQAKDYTDKLQKQADDYQKQADADAIELPDMAQKVRSGLAKQDEYNALASQVQALRSQADTSRMVSENYQTDSDNYRKGTDQLAAAQKPAPQEGSGLFDTPEEAAADFAKRAMPLTDETSHEYSAVMTEVQVPEYKDGKIQMVPKYKYGDIMAGEINNVAKAAATGLLAPTEGKKYLLHTHPNNTDYESDNFSGVPILVNTEDAVPVGDTSIPTLAGKYGLPFVLNNLPQIAAILGNTGLSAAMQLIKNATGTSLSGYDGIYLAAPSGTLYYYNGLGSGKYHGNTYQDLRNQENFKVPVDLPKAKGKWENGAQTYKLGYWENGKFIEY